MITAINQHHWTDEATGAPAGGVTQGRGFVISWQNGRLQRGPERTEPNGAFVEDVIFAVIGRLQYYQDGRFKCAENETALGFLDMALRALECRTVERQARGVEGTHEE